MFPPSGRNKLCYILQRALALQFVSHRSQVHDAIAKQYNTKMQLKIVLAWYQLVFSRLALVERDE